MINTISVPITLTYKGKRYPINLNQYHNWYPFTRNGIKQEYAGLINPAIFSLPKYTHPKITYVLYKDSKRKCDIENVICLVSKFFCDALVKAGKLPDDGYEYISHVEYRWGGIDKNNPRVDITLEE